MILVHKEMVERTILNVLVPKSLCERLSTPDCSTLQFCKSLKKCAIRPILLADDSAVNLDFEQSYWNGEVVPPIKNSIFVSDNRSLKHPTHLAITSERVLLNDCSVVEDAVTISSLQELLSCLLGCERLERDDRLPFGHIALPASQVFGMTSLSFCSVNLKPFAPGHVLVLPRRPVPTLDRLREEEMADLMRLTHRVVKMIKHCYHTQAVTVAVQDGPAAGQTVPHVHVHVIPRMCGDLPEDAIYDMLEKADLKPVLAGSQTVNPDAKRVPRSAEDMHKEAVHYMELLNSLEYRCLFKTKR